MTHTPGPWEVIPPTSEYPSRARVGGSGCDIYDAPLTNETMSNAHLIAAAPDLLAACQRALLTGGGSSGTADILHAAINKATA